MSHSVSTSSHHERRFSTSSKADVYEGEAYTLSPELDMALSAKQKSAKAAKCCWTFRRREVEIVLSEKTLSIQSSSFIRKYFPCCISSCCHSKADSFTGFESYLALKYGKFIASKSPELASLDFHTMRTLSVADARRVIEVAEVIKRRFQDLDDLVKWVRWHHLSQSIDLDDQQQATVLTPSNRSYVPGTRMIKDEHGNIIEHKFSRIFRRVLKIPFTQPITDDTLVKIDGAVKAELQKTDFFAATIEDVVHAIIKTIKKSGYVIQTPPDSLFVVPLDNAPTSVLIARLSQMEQESLRNLSQEDQLTRLQAMKAADLKSNLQRYDSARHLEASDLKELLKKEADYMTPFLMKDDHRASLSSTKINSLLEGDSKGNSFFKGKVPLSDV